uniref:Uncharacterized protein n=1 Tax=Steinernema glaseri TaxID=37863 RepID=A0A1I7YC92_9BILA
MLETQCNESPSRPAVTVVHCYPYPSKRDALAFKSSALPWLTYLLIWTCLKYICPIELWHPYIIPLYFNVEISTYPHPISHSSDVVPGPIAYSSERAATTREGIVIRVPLTKARRSDRSRSRFLSLPNSSANLSLIKAGAMSRIALGSPPRRSRILALRLGGQVKANKSEAMMAIRWLRWAPKKTHIPQRRQKRIKNP